MNTRHYEFRIIGLQEEEGRIRATTLSRVMDALFATAERTTRLLATGAGVGRGARPRWLEVAVDFTVTGLKPGSTTIGIEAPHLKETAYEHFAQSDSRSRQPNPNETALDLAARSINESQMENPAGDYFDRAVLEAIGKFEKATRVAGVRYEMVPLGTTTGRFIVDDITCARVRDRLNDIPTPEARIVSGRLEEISFEKGAFRLLVNQKLYLSGRICNESLDVEALRPLWGKPITIEGMVHFKTNGEARLIEARRIGKRLETDGVFEEMPSVEVQHPFDLFSDKIEQVRDFDPIELSGAWPGDEPIEELLDQLD